MQSTVVLVAVLAYALSAEGNVSETGGSMLLQTRARFLGETLHRELEHQAADVVEVRSGDARTHQRTRSIKAEHPELEHQEPDVVVVGVGDSGTRGVIAALHRLGLRMCNITNHQLDNRYTYQSHHIVDDFLNSSGGLVSNNDGYRRASATFAQAVDAEVKGAGKTKECADRVALKNATSSWGYKSPQHFYLMPVMDEAFNEKHNVLIVARDPRDICSGHNQDQFVSFGQLVLGRNITDCLIPGCLEKGKNIQECSIPDCWEKKRVPECLESWARAWQSVLDEYAGNDRVRIVRIEDLVVRESGSRRAKRAMDCTAKHAGLTIDQDSRHRELKIFHQFKSSYMGGHFDEIEPATYDIEKGFAIYESRVRDVMRLLGYDTAAYGLVQPTSKQVC